MFTIETANSRNWKKKMLNLDCLWKDSAVGLTDYIGSREPSKSGGNMKQNLCT